jgi:hypothetical protein
VTRRTVALVVVLCFLTIAPWRAYAASTGDSADQISGMSISRPEAIGVGAVIGYGLMLSAVGTAIMGAAMGAMLAVVVYDAYSAPAAPALSTK